MGFRKHTGLVGLQSQCSYCQTTRTLSSGSGHCAGPGPSIVGLRVELLACLLLPVLLWSLRKAGPNTYCMAPQKGIALQGGRSHCPRRDL